MDILYHTTISRKPAGRHLARVRFANEMRKGGVGGGGGGNGPKITPFQCKLGGRGGTLAR